jgi:tetratricopeptide (TPR) repeat protein
VLAFDEAIALNEDYTEAYYYLGVALKAQDMWADAVVAFNEVIARKKDHALTHIRRGEALYQLGDYAASAGDYRAAFAAKPELANDLKEQYRYNAACAAALAGCGQGKDADKLDHTERALLRKQALDWLRDDLKAYNRAVVQGKSQGMVALRLTDWQKDPDLAGIRDKEALAKAKLPETERANLQTLWTDVEALRKQAGKPE